MFNYITKSIIPIIVLIIITYGMIKGRKVYQWFVEGAKEGLKVCANIFPYLLAMIVAVNIFRSAKLLDFVNNFISPVASIIGLPKEVVPLVLIKPLSGSGAMGIFTDILNNYGADSFIGLVASVIMGRKTSFWRRRWRKELLSLTMRPENRKSVDVYKRQQGNCGNGGICRAG